MTDTLDILLLGPPGCGKGTQSKMLSAYLQIPQIAMGDMLRKSMENKTLLGIKAKKYVEKGELVPDDIIIGVIEKRLNEDNCQRGFVLDGFPRTVPQAEALKHMLHSFGRKINIAVTVNVPEDDLVDRLSGRQICLACGREYHILYKKPQEYDVCDSCGGKLGKRKDDVEETIRKRLKLYAEKTKPLLDYYGCKGVLRAVNGVGEIDEVFQRIQKILE